MRVKVFTACFSGAVGYDLRVESERASVQDYLDALNKFQDDYVASCKGCDNCCWERIPLTSIDVLTYTKNPGIRKMLPDNLPPLTAFVHRFCRVRGEGPVLDIFLRQKDSTACEFLDEEQQICREHASRSLVCQTFICLPHSERAGALRDTLLNTGEDELVRKYLEETAAGGLLLRIDENKSACPCLEDYPPNGFSGKKKYCEVLIKDVVTPALWAELVKEQLVHF